MMTKKDKLEKYGPTFVFCIALIIFILHLFNLSQIDVTIDNTTILLLVLLLISPFASKLRKIKIGPLEAEIEPEEVKEVQKEVDSLPERENEYPYSQIIADDIYETLEYDFIVALNKIRFELERILRKMATLKTEKETVKGGTNNYLKILRKMNVLELDLISPIKKVLDICNRAIHGESINKRESETVVNMGLALLNELYFIYFGKIIEPFEKTEITKAELKKYFDSEYEVTTVVPLVEKPHMQKRLVTQDGLYFLLKGYEEYGEFLVDIKRIKKKNDR